MTKYRATRVYFVAQRAVQRRLVRSMMSGRLVTFLLLVVVMMSVTMFPWVLVLHIKECGHAVVRRVVKSMSNSAS